MLDQCLGIAQGHRHRHQVQGVDQLYAGGAATLHLEGDHAAKIAQTLSTAGWL